MPSYFGAAKTEVGKMYLGRTGGTFTEIGKAYLWNGSAFVEVFSADTLKPAGMNKSGTYVINSGSPYGKVPGWVVRPGFADTSIAGDGLVMLGAGTVNLFAHLEREGQTLSYLARLCKNGVEIPGSAVTSAAYVLEMTVNGVAVQAGDVITVEAYGTSTITVNRTLTAASYLTASLPA